MTDDKRLWPKFSPEINFGHLLQATVILVTIGGGAITSYLSLRSDIQQVRADLTVKVTSVRLKREQIQLIALDAVVRFVFDSGNRLTEQHFFEERHGQDL